jgi:hypothetical protein
MQRKSKKRADRIVGAVMKVRKGEGSKSISKVFGNLGIMPQSVDSLVSFYQARDNEGRE